MSRVAEALVVGSLSGVPPKGRGKTRGAAGRRLAGVEPRDRTPAAPRRSPLAS